MSGGDRPPQLAAVSAALAVFDEDGDGQVPIAELKRVLGWSFPGSKPLSASEIDRIVRLLGSGPASGMVSVNEVAAVFSAPRFKPNGAPRMPMPPQQPSP